MTMNVGVTVALGAAAALALAFATVRQDKPKVDAKVVNLNMESPKRPDKVVKSDEEWKAQLTPEQYKILRHANTERPFCGVNLDNKGAGVYECVGCGLPLFKSDGKFNSGTGWPSFFNPIDKDNVWYRTDHEFGMVRTEILCARCDGHLGHVFDDGPPPTGRRYCINGTVLKFVPEK